MKQLPLKRFLAEEIAFAQRPDVLFFRSIGLLYRHANLPFAYYEKRVSSCSLSDYVIPIVVKGLQKYVHDME